MKYYVGDKVRALGMYGIDEREIGIIKFIKHNSSDPRYTHYAVQFRRGKGIHDCDGFVPKGTGLWLKGYYMQLAYPSENRQP